MGNETKVVISAETAKAEANIRTLGQSVDGLTRNFFNLSSVAGTLGGALTITAFAGFIKNSIDAADTLNDLSQKTGTSVETLAGLRLAADQSGTSMDAIANSAKKLSTEMADKPELFKKFGITATDTTGALIQLADIFATMPDGIEKAALAQQLFGKSGADMIPLLNQGSEALRKQIEQGKEYSKVTSEMAAQADLFNDQLAEMKMQASGFGTEIASKMIGPMNEIVAAMREANKEGGIFKALWVGLGGVGTAIFTDDFSKNAPKPDLFKSEMKRYLERGRQAQADSAGSQMLRALDPEKSKKEKYKLPFDPDADFWYQVEVARDKRLLKEHADYEKAREEMDKNIEEAFLASREKLADITEEKTKKAMEANEKAAKESAKSWERFTDNVQRNLGDVLYNGMQGKFDGIVDMFRHMLMRMAADAAAADLTRMLFPTGGGGGLAGMFGGMFSSKPTGLPGMDQSMPIMAADIPGYAGGGYTGNGSRSGGLDGMGGFLAMLHPKETVIDHASGGRGGISISPTYSISIDSRSDRSEVYGMVMSAVQAGNAMLVDQLERSGRLA